jgi:hypothetical protein
MAIACREQNSGFSPSNRTALWIEVLPPLPPTGTGVVDGRTGTANVTAGDSGDSARENSRDRGLEWWFWLLIVLILLCCCCCIILFFCWYRKRDKPKRRKSKRPGGGGNFGYTLKDHDNPMHLPTAALAVGGAKPEYSPRTKISMMSRLGSKPMIALQENHHVELAKISATPTAAASKNRGRSQNFKKSMTSANALKAIPETLTSGKVLNAPARKSMELVAPPPVVPAAPSGVPADAPPGV